MPEQKKPMTLDTLPSWMEEYGDKAKAAALEAARKKQEKERKEKEEKERAKKAKEGILNPMKRKQIEDAWKE